MKKIALLLIFMFSGNLFSQENPNIKIGLKNNHYSNITSVLLTKDEKKIISADITGKILMYNTSDYSYDKTIRESSGIPIQGMRLIKNDSILMFSQKYNYSDGTNDSLIMISVNDNKILLKEKRSLSFLGNLKSDVIISNTTKNYNSSIEFISQDLKKIVKFETDKTISNAEISKNKEKVIYTESDYSEHKNIIIREVVTGAIIKEIPIPEGTNIVHLFFDENAENIYVVSYTESNKAISVHKGKETINWSKPIYTMPFGSYYSDTIVSDTESNNSHSIIFTSNIGFNQKPVIIKNQGDNFSLTTFFSESVDMDKNASHSLFFKSKNEIIFFRAYNSGYFDIAGFFVYDLSKQKITREYPETTSDFYMGYFLPQDNWIVIDRNDGNLKYYSAGTFKNRYDKMNINNYIQVKHNLESIGAFFFDKQNGIQIYLGRERDKVLDAKYSYYKYDLINDKVYKLFDEKKNYYAILDFNDKNKNLLLSKHAYSDQNDLPSQIMVLSDNKEIEFPDTYKFGKFSKNGNYLLTINKDDVVEVRLLTANKILYSKQLAKGNYSILSIDESSFIITNNLRKKNISVNCYTQTIIIGIENDIVTDSIKDCVIISDASYVNDNMAMILNDIVVVVNDKPVLFKGNESPLEISFNSDASKFMISFKNGSIVIYDTKTFQELGRMIHPNENSHVFLDNQNHYFSNIDAEEYLWATKNNQAVSLKSIDKEVFKPEKLLALFGTPNEEYSKVLQQALSIRDETKTKVVYNDTKDSIVKPVEELDKPNLYLVSIGVSDYKQSNYNLTFADKDALDISKIYGTLNEKEYTAYNDKFFGNLFTINDKKGQGLKKISKFLGDYKSVGEFYSIGKDDIWVELHNGKINLWNFNEKTVDSISVPKDFSMANYAMDKNFIPMPNGTGFSIKGYDDNVLSYNYSTKKSKVYKLPLNVHENNYTLIDEDQWLVFDYKHVDSTSTISIAIYDAVNNKTIPKLKFNPHHYQNRDVSGSSKNIDVENYSSYIIPELRAVSPNGKYLIYSTDSESVFCVDLTQSNPKPVKVNPESILKYDSKISVSSDGKKFCVLNKNSDTFTTIVLDMYGKTIDNQMIENKNYSIKGISINNADPKWIKMSNQLLEDSFFENEDNKLINSATPFSFDNVYTANFVNQNADSKSIKNSLSNFFKKTKSNDQVMIFMAGHGMLDSKNNYYFAPHDMDFEKPETNGISFDFIINSLKNTPAKNKLLLLDSCHSGTTLDMTETNSNSNTINPVKNQRGSGAIAINQKANFKVSEVISSLFENFLSTSGVTILSASSGSDVAFEYKNAGNGAFTSSYIQLLKEKLNNGVSLDSEDLNKPLVLSKDFITEFFKRVMIATENKQVPDIREINDKADIKIW